MLYAGLDVHKNFCQAIVMTKDGVPVKKERIHSNREDITKFFDGLGDVKVAFEASSPYEYFYDILDDIGCDVSLSHPLKTRLIAESKIKTDKIDAKILWSAPLETDTKLRCYSMGVHHGAKTKKNQPRAQAVNCYSV